MAEFPSLPFFTDAYLADTGHLSCLESGAYLHLLFCAWRSPDCTIPNDEKLLARMARCSTKEWRRVRSNVMAFWVLDEESQKWSQKRLMRVRVWSRSKSQRAAQSANARWLNNKETDDANASSKHMQNACLDDASISISISKESKERVGAPNGSPSALVVSSENKVSKGKRGERLPQDWKPSAEQILWAQQARGDLEISQTADRFRDYWIAQPGQKGVKVDWGATWRNWVRNERPGVKADGKSKTVRAIDDLMRGFSNDVA